MAQHAAPHHHVSAGNEANGKHRRALHQQTADHRAHDLEQILEAAAAGGDDAASRGGAVSLAET